MRKKLSDKMLFVPTLNGVTATTAPPPFHDRALAVAWVQWQIRNAPETATTVRGSVTDQSTGRVLYEMARTGLHVSEHAYNARGVPLERFPDYTAQAYAWIDRERLLLGRAIMEGGRRMTDRCAPEALRAQVSDLQQLLDEAVRLTKLMGDLHYDPELAMGPPDGSTDGSILGHGNGLSS